MCDEPKVGDRVVFHDKRWGHLIIGTIIGLGEGTFKCDIRHEAPPWIKGKLGEFSIADVDGFRVLVPAELAGVTPS